MSLAVIPARGGSRRIHRKNIKKFCGKPIIAWTIAAARKSNCFERIIVSTEDSEIAEVAQQYGADVPFMRPLHLADDYCGTIPVVANAVEWMIGAGYHPKFTCCLYPTAPLISGEIIKTAFNKLLVNDNNFVFPVTTFPYPIQRALRVNEKGKLQMFSPELFNTRSQDLQAAYHDAGQFYWGKTQAWLTQDNIYTSNSDVVIMSRYRVQDIDTIEDWRQAELMFDLLNKSDLD